MHSELIVIRHGQSLSNQRKTATGKLEVFAQYGDANVPLSDAGEEQARVLGLGLNAIIQSRLTRAFSSPYKRALRTMDIALQGVSSDRAIRRTIDAGLREKEYYGLRTGEAKDFFKSDYSETSENLCKRVSSSVRFLLSRIKLDLIGGHDERSRVKCNLVFMHGESMRALHYCLLKATPEDYTRWKNPWNCSAYRYKIEWKNGHFHIETINGPENFLDLSKQ